MDNLYSTLKNIGVNVLGGGIPTLSKMAVTKAKDALSTVAPGLKAGIESIKQGSTAPYKQFLAENPLKMPDLNTKEGQQEITEMTLNFAPMGMAKNVVSKLVKETSSDIVKGILQKDFKGLAKQAIEEYAPKLAKAGSELEVNALLNEAKQIPLSASEKLIEAIKAAKPQRTEISVAQTVERSRRATEAISAGAGKDGNVCAVAIYIIITFLITSRPNQFFLYQIP